MKIKRNDRDECIYIETRRKRKEKEELRKEKKIFQYHPRRVGAREKEGGRGGRGSRYYRGYLGEFATESLRVRCRCSRKQRGH